MSAELEVLDQLQGGDLGLEVVARLFPSTAAFTQGVRGLLECHDVVLTTREGTELANWQWRKLFSEREVLKNLKTLRLRITPQGSNRIE